MATCSPHDPPDDEAVEQAAPSVIRLLSKAAALRTLDAKPEKVYHELWESYTWDELLEEIQNRTEVGKRYVRTIVAAAAARDVSVDEYLRVGKGA
jgi:hypothetical protein